MGKANYIDLRNPSQLLNFNKLLKTFKKNGTFILVHADFCGPCQQYKKTVWNDLVAKKGRKVGLAGIHYDQLENSPFSGANIKGYPSVIYVTQNGTVKKVSNFNDSETGTQTNAMPSDTMRNKELMEKLVNSEPHEIQAAIPSMEKEAVDNVEAVSSSDESSSEESSSDEEPSFSAEATAVRDNVTAESALKTVNNLEKPLSKKGTPPKVNDDIILDSATENKSNASPVINFDPRAPNEAVPAKGKGSAVGGGALYKSLVVNARRRAKTNKKRSLRNQKKKTRRR